MDVRKTQGNAQKNAWHAPKLAVVSDFAPFPGGLGSHVVLRLGHLAQRFDVVLIVLYDRPDELKLPEGIGVVRLGLDARATSKDVSSSSSMAAKVGIGGICAALSNAFLHHTPMFYGAFANNGAREKLRNAIEECKPDAVLAMRYICCELVRGIESKYPVFLDLGDRISVYYSGILAHPSAPLVKKAAAMIDVSLARMFEDEVEKRCAGAFYISQRDRAGSAAAADWPHVRARAEKTASSVKKRDIIMVGDWGTWANRDSYEWAVGEILPRCNGVKAAAAGPGSGKMGVKNAAAGAEAGVAEKGGGKAGAYDIGFEIEGLGFVDDLHGEIAASKALLAPLRLGSGMQHKVLDALSAGIPVITTAIGKGGVVPPEKTNAVVVCKTPQEFADAIARAKEGKIADEKECIAAYNEYCAWTEKCNKAAIGKIYSAAMEKTASAAMEK